MDDLKLFSESFHALTGNVPFRWQERLFREFVAGRLPSALDLPTGLGKTSVMAIWLIARALASDEARKMLPRRLVYVVDRRAVVDQATEEAEKLRQALEGDAVHFSALDELSRARAKDSAASLKRRLGLVEKRKLPISTLRGRYMDNQEWLKDPSLQAIIVGTVDMIGSRLLFSGYGASRRMRPYHAGLLGADALVVLDEAHLVPPFAALIEQVREQTAADSEHAAARFQVPSLKTMALSATGRQTSGAVFKLDDGDIEQDAVVRGRIHARKWLRIEQAAGDLAMALAERAWDLSNQRRRVIVFSNSRKIANDVYGEIEKRLKRALGRQAVQRGEHLEMIVGARRVRERELLAASPVFRRFAHPPPKEEGPQSAGPAFLIATSAGEVGVDIDADHMVCDLVTWERMVQRLGRVNRRGEFAEGSLIDVLVATPDKDAEFPTGTPTIDDCRAPFDDAAWPKHDGRLDASLNMLRKLREDSRFKQLTDKATTAEPLRPALTRELLQAWSMTSLPEHPGRPKVEPWLRGWLDEEKDLPQTEVLWRRHLPIRRVDDPLQARRELAAFFAAAPPHISEILETETYRVVELLRGRARALLRGEDDDAELATGAAAEADDPRPPLTKRTIVAVVLNRDGSVERLLRLADIQTQDAKRLHAILANGRVVLDARLGGLAVSGMLDQKENDEPATLDGERVPSITDEEGASLWSDQRLRQSGFGFRVRITRRAEIVRRHGDEEGWKVVYRRFLDAESEDADDAGERLEWRVEEWVGDNTAENDPELGKIVQSLNHHRDRVVFHAARIAECLKLPDVLRTMLVTAARYHDCGKARVIWQRYAGNHGFLRDKTQAVAKFAGWANPQMLKVGDDDFYRHEFGSLHDAVEGKAFDDLPPWVRRLGLRLIAAHHGHARPMIVAYDESRPADRSVALAEQVGRDFVMLLAEWGPWGLAWWEALLRAADAAASREKMEDAPGEKVEEEKH